MMLSFYVFADTGKGTRIDFKLGFQISMALSDTLAAHRQRIDAELAERLPPADTRPALVHEAMRYAVLAGGKRLRPILCLAAANAVRSDAPIEPTLSAGLATELLHTYTLVHDDLPCMDDDDLRRGKPTTHIAFGEANAVLAGDALLTLAFEWLGRTGEARLVTELAKAAGSQGVIGGQIEDLASEKSDVAPASLAANPERADSLAETLDYIHRHKTAALLVACVRMGGICVDATPDQLAALTMYGQNIGLAFQIIDDILDATVDTDTLGKPAGSDEAQNKLTFVALHGIDASRERAAALIEDAVDAVHSHGLQGDFLAELASFVLERGT